MLGPCGPNMAAILRGCGNAAHPESTSERVTASANFLQLALPHNRGGVNYTLPRESAFTQASKNRSSLLVSAKELAMSGWFRLWIQKASCSLAFEARDVERFHEAVHGNRMTDSGSAPRVGYFDTT